MSFQATKIEWCTHTWNPVTGCYHDCDYCYARGQVQRFGGHYIAARGENDYPAVNAQHMAFADFNDGKGERWLYEPLMRCPNDEQIMTKAGILHKAPYPYGFIPTLHESRLGDPARHKRPAIVFVGSMCDLFGKWVPDEWIEQVFKACAESTWHRYIFLTKNPGRYYDVASIIIQIDEANDFTQEPYLFGATITTQAQADAIKRTWPTGFPSNHFWSALTWRIS